MIPEVLLAVDNNPEYLFLTPVVCLSWKLQGFKCRVAFNNVNKSYKDLIVETMNDLEIEYTIEDINMHSDTQNRALYTQCHRMYMTKNLDNDTYYIMSDIDMFIASNFLSRDFDRVNSFGYDLTGYGQVPMCYVGMSGKKWKELMGNYDIEADLKTYARKDSNDFYVAWGCDQDILTGRLRGILGFHSVNFIPRGTDPNNSRLPIGRWDRHNWVKPNSTVHDVHVLRSPHMEPNFTRIKEMCIDIYPNKDWNWIDEYKTKFNSING